MSDTRHSPRSSLEGQPNFVVSTLADDHSKNIQKVGILSQTLTSSPHIRWILPARIRSRHQNDVVFVGESCIQLREFLPNGQLADVTAKLNFGAQIMAAKVISAKKEIITATDAILNQDYDEEKFIIKGQPCKDDRPPQIVVLCTAHSELIYIYAKDIGNKGAKFVFAKRSILHGVSMPTKYGRHMAVDPESKAMAVATSDTCILFSLKDVDDLKASIDACDPRQPASFQPSKEQRFLPVDGKIVRMEFLCTPESEEEKVYLLLLVAKSGQTRMLLYRWDSRGLLVDIECVSTSGQALPLEDTFPLLLFRSNVPVSFLLVTETELVYYEDVRTASSAKRHNTPLDDDNNNDTTPTNKALWVSWAKPSRHEKYQASTEDILLMREDGLTRMHSRQRSPGGNPLVHRQNPGDLHMRVDTAVCMLPGPRGMGGDILIVGGTGTDGGVFHIPPREYPRLLQTIPNMSPVRDMIVLDAQSLDKNQDSSFGRTFVLSDELDGGRISELRFGLEAQIGWTFEAPDCATIDRLWALDLPGTTKIYYVLSHPEHTAVAEFDLEAADLEFIDTETCLGFDLEATTLAAACLANGDLMQITAAGINIATKPLRLSPPCATVQLPNCVCASIDTVSGLFVAACSTSSSHELRIGMVKGSQDDRQILIAPNRPQIGSRPLAMAITQGRDSHLLAVGFFDGSLKVLSIHADAGMHELASLQPSETGGAAITSIALLGHHKMTHMILLVGSQGGKLTVLNFNVNTAQDSTEPPLHVIQVFSLGPTVVHITPEVQRSIAPLNALINCGSRFGRFRLFNGGNHPDFVFDNIWITNRNNISYAPTSVHAVYRVPFLDSTQGAEPSGLIMCASENGILFTSLLEQEQMVPRVLARTGNFRHVIHLRSQKRLLVATNNVSDDQDRPSLPPTLHLIDPNHESSAPDSSVPIICGDARDRISAMIEWCPSDGRSHRVLVLLGLNDGTDSRLGYLNARKLARENSTRGDIKIVMKFIGKQILALCSYGMSSAIIGVGSQLILLHLDPVSRKFEQQCSFKLPSPAISIAARGSMVYAATKKHSLMVFRIDGHTFTRIFADKAASNARSVVPFGQQKRHVIFSTTSETGTAVVGYVDGTDTTQTPSPSFEAHVPLPIDQLVPIATSWSHNQHYGFQGNTVDGTIYCFKTLEHTEWKLLRYLEKIAQPDINKPVKKQASLLTGRMARTWMSAMEHEGVSTHKSRSMHVNGDVLQRMIEEGSEDLRDLLGIRVKQEDEMMTDADDARLAKFENLAEPVLGRTDDPVAAVTAWVRRLLRSSVF